MSVVRQGFEWRAGSAPCRNAYKVTEKDALAFREVGLSDEAYVDVLDTASIQTSLDRLANALGVTPDAAPSLAT